MGGNDSTGLKNAIGGSSASQRPTDRSTAPSSVSLRKPTTVAPWAGAIQAQKNATLLPKESSSSYPSLQEATILQKQEQRQIRSDGRKRNIPQVSMTRAPAANKSAWGGNTHISPHAGHLKSSSSGQNTRRFVKPVGVKNAWGIGANHEKQSTTQRNRRIPKPKPTRKSCRPTMPGKGFLERTKFKT